VSAWSAGGEYTDLDRRLIEQIRGSYPTVIAIARRRDGHHVAHGPAALLERLALLTWPLGEPATRPLNHTLLFGNRHTA
jgi:hypothetical protein